MEGVKKMTDLMMRSRAWDPFWDLQREMNRLFTGVAAPAETFPAVNVWTSRDQVVVTAELPGVDAKALDVSVHGDALTLKGERPEDTAVESAVCHRAERWSGRFSRTIRLPFAVENGQVKAKCRNGVLTVTLPRAESSKPRQVAIVSE
jgi:HSP20 family protein